MALGALALVDRRARAFSLEEKTNLPSFFSFFSRTLSSGEIGYEAMSFMYC